MYIHVSILQVPNRHGCAPEMNDIKPYNNEKGSYKYKYKYLLRGGGQKVKRQDLISGKH